MSMSVGEIRLYSQGVQMLQVGLWVPLNPREEKLQNLFKKSKLYKTYLQHQFSAFLKYRLVSQFSLCNVQMKLEKVKRSAWICTGSPSANIFQWQQTSTDSSVMVRNVPLRLSSLLLGFLICSGLLASELVHSFVNSSLYPSCAEKHREFKDEGHNALWKALIHIVYTSISNNDLLLSKYFIVFWVWLNFLHFTCKISH